MYLVFARKYRPETFADVVGQAHIATTLQNAVKNDRVAHAYLFCGSRGIGKTTMARILAKALNCAEGPTPEPCCKCESCRRIAAGDDMDVMEIDGASNRGIDEIRELRQNVKYAPAHSKYKVYYIDEVHMLTVPAFNALLKTLEEPPPHVKFIFSTTDPQQLPDTVKSRCQRFDFRRISDAEIIGHLERICEKEKLEPEKGALRAVARSARGGLRDALSVLDQVAAFSDKEVKLSDVLTILGAVNTQSLTEIVDAVAEGRTGAALTIVHKALFSGVDLLDLADQLAEYLRDLLVAGYCGPEDELLAGAAADTETIKRQSALFNSDQLLYMIQLLREAKLRARRDTCGRLALEMAIVKLSRLEDLVPIGEALQRLDSPAPTQPQRTGRRSGPPDPSRAPSRGVDAAPQGRPASPPADVAAKRSSRAKRILEKLGAARDNGRAAGEPAAAAPPEGIDPGKFRQIRQAADSSEAVDQLREEEPLLEAFREADAEFGLRPVRLKGRRSNDGHEQADDGLSQQ